MSFQNFVATWKVFLVMETDLAAPGGTLGIGGDENDVEFFPEDMGSEGDHWAEATGTYNEQTNQISGFVSGSRPNNRFSMAVGSPGGSQQFLSCLIRGREGAMPPEPARGRRDVEGGDPGSWTATDGPGEF